MRGMMSCELGCWGHEGGIARGLKCGMDLGKGCGTLGGWMRGLYSQQGF